MARRRERRRKRRRLRTMGECSGGGSSPVIFDGNDWSPRITATNPFGVSWTPGREGGTKERGRGGRRLGRREKERDWRRK